MTNVIAVIAQVAIATLLVLLLSEVRKVVWLVKTVQSQLSDIHTTIVDECTIQHGLPRDLRGLSGHIINAIESKDFRKVLSETIQDAFIEMERTEAASKAFRERPNNPFIKPKE